MNRSPPAVDRDDGPMGSGKYFPIPAMPTFGSSELGASFQALASHPKYRAVLQPYGDVHLDRYKKSLDLLRSWERIAERYTAIDVEDDLEIDVMTGDTIHRGETIHLDEEETLELWGDDYVDEEDDEDDMLDDSKICQSGDAVLNKLKGSAFQEGDDDWDVLGFWGPESEMQAQAEALPDISSFPVKAASKKDQAELAAFLRHEDGRKRLEQLGTEESVPAIDSDDHVEYAVDAYSDKRHASTIVMRNENGAAMSVPHPDESPKKKRKVGRPRLIRAALTENPHNSPRDPAFSAAAITDPSSDDVDLCSDTLAVPNDLFRTPKPLRGSGTRARRGRRPNIALLTPRKTGSSRETRPEQFSAEWLDQNLLRSEITTPYVSRSSRVVKVPERWGAHIQWASIRRKRNKQPTSDAETKRAPLECFVDLPAVPLDWREYTRSLSATESAVSTKGLAASSEPEDIGDGYLLRLAEEPTGSTGSSRGSSPIEPVTDANGAAPPASSGALDELAARSLSCVESACPPDVTTLLIQADDEVCPDVVEVLAEPSTIPNSDSGEDREDDSSEAVLRPDEQETSLDLDSRNSSPLSSPSLSLPPDEEDDRLARSPSSPLSSAPALSDYGDLAEGRVDEPIPDYASVSAAACGDEVLYEAGSGIVASESRLAYDDIPSVQDQPPSQAEASDTASDFEDTIYVQPWSHPIERERDSAPPTPLDWHPVKYELLPDDDPLCQNTMDGELDELNLELSLNRRVMLPISVKLPRGTKGSAISNPITIDDEEDELGGWDLDGWS